MKKLISIFVLLLLFLSGEAATYYVSESDGNDSDSGLTTALAWKTLAKVNAATLLAGDIVRFKRGDTFIGTLTLTKTGTVSNPVTYSAYGSGAKPVITSMVTLSGWTLHSTGIYKVSGSVVPTDCDIVTIDGVNTPMGKYPQNGYNAFETFTGRTSFVDTELTNTPNFSGSEVVIFKSNWILDRSAVTNHTNGTVTYTSGSSYNPDGTGGNNYFFQKDIDCLLKLGDWFTDGTDFYMYFGANSPSGYVVKAGASSTTITASKSYNVLDNLEIQGGNSYAVYSTLTNGLTLNKCDIKNAGRFGFSISSSTTTTVDSCTFSNINGTGASIISATSKVSYCTFDKCGQFPGMGDSGGSSFMGLNFRSADGVTEYNTFTDIGYIGVYFYGNNHIVRYNVVDGFCLLGLADGAAIYTYYGVEGSSQSGMKIYSNVVANGLGTGLYPDNLSNNQEWYNNTVYNVEKYGLHSNMPVNNYIHHNTLVDCTIASIDIQNLTAQTTPASGNTISNNICIQGAADQKFISFRDNRTNQLLSVPFGTSNNNTLIADNLATNVCYNQYVSPSYTATNYTWANWKTFTGLEAASTYTNKDLSTLQFIYNDTHAAKVVAISGAKTDLGGVNIYQTSVTLQPYTSLLLLPATVPNQSGYTKILKHGSTPLKHNGQMLVVP